MRKLKTFSFAAGWQMTLSEEYGEAYLFDELSKHSTFYDDELLYP